MEVRDSFGKALRFVRQRRGLAQEDFSLVSSRTFVSMLERGATSPTLEKLDSLCTVLDTHPVTLLALTYLLGSEAPESFEQLLEKVGEELRALVEPD
ncbi:TPA: helix-turn-helix transcriptional regulator [Pseudomonas aeruginosa]|jgi:transcriptional regulator with XRE-family HTH domain|uniref:helix-turn-helix domain-containing protein n=1 Tax=Pseudomonas TaxID=286 RepID=UPI0005F2C396|nr:MULTISPECIES: helix-turn-helix transcriptional regulator [Pseudomonas]KJU80111.1 DNA-binding protein [Pseudomonas oleovorans]OZB30491.1 MAG: transcriptional regulator [Pseudomonas sp. 34-62-33]AYK22608.1 XRE family transcriptional regulator [Pseudomonas aeruginosa]EIU3952376.1 helix-turn-helix transcriptional regulator [Pseudomonas aeruginosa]EIU3964481.1 helix-turn-helix transcriptional regulator [Pseudomonas aeruginosa]